MDGILINYCIYFDILILLSYLSFELKNGGIQLSLGLQTITIDRLKHLEFYPNRRKHPSKILKIKRSNACQNNNRSINLSINLFKKDATILQICD